MNRHNQSKTTTPLFVVVVLAGFVLLPKVLATDLGGVVAGNNIADGSGVLVSRTTGVDNSGFGFQALNRDTTGSFNTATGIRALYTNVSGLYNTADGAFALAFNNGSNNVANGYQALYNNTSGGFNTATGNQALYHNTTGFRNTAAGYQALYSNNTTNGFIGSSNTALGYQALISNTNGEANTAIGDTALVNNTTGGSNIAIGFGAGFNVIRATGVIAIGSLAADVSSSCFIGNISGVQTQNNDAMPVYIDSAGQLGTASSSRRFKTDIKPMDKTSESILALKPVSFRYKVHKDSTPQFGLIAEDVAGVNPDLVIYDAGGKPYAVRYEAVNAMLLNEFLKEHRAFVKEQRKVEQQEVTITQLKKQVEALTKGLQKVSDQLELSKPAPQTVLNNQ